MSSIHKWSSLCRSDGRFWKIRNICESFVSNQWFETHIKLPNFSKRGFVTRNDSKFEWFMNQFLYMIFYLICTHLMTLVNERKSCIWDSFHCITLVCGFSSASKQWIILRSLIRGFEKLRFSHHYCALDIKFLNNSHINSILKITFLPHLTLIGRWWIGKNLVHHQINQR